MAWKYRLLDEPVDDGARWPACPHCGNLGTVVLVTGDVYACLNEYPYRSFQAWQEGPEPESEGEAS